MFEAQVLQVQEYWCELIWHQHSSEQIKKKRVQIVKAGKEKKKLISFFRTLSLSHYMNGVSTGFFYLSNALLLNELSNCKLIFSVFLV